MAFTFVALRLSAQASAYERPPIQLLDSLHLREGQAINEHELCGRESQSMKNAYDVKVNV
ncbi:hypothetical protein WG66_002791 [Moniliophthora roreri]|nr:hypothetical protein WG66_002791 [Moniliophthora roreri]